MGAQPSGSQSPPGTPGAPAPDGAAPAQPTPEEVAAAKAAALEADLKALRETTEALKASLEATQAELGAEREQRAEEVVVLQEQAEKQKAASATSVKLSGFLQADWNAWRQSSEDQINPGTNDIVNDERFLIRRARLRASVERGILAGLMELDGNTSRGTVARLIAAEASLKWPGEPQKHGEPPLAMLSFGLLKIPFGFEVVQSDRDRLFMERSTAERALFPGEYDLGVRFSGGWRFLRYAIAVQNGEPLGERAWPGRDPNGAKDVAGRVGVDTALGESFWISGGFSGLGGTGFHPGTPGTKPSIQWVDRDENGSFSSNEIVATPGTAATASFNFPRFAYGADLRAGLRIDGVGQTIVGGEIYLAKNLDRFILTADPRGPLGRDFRELGGYASITQELGDLFALGVRYDYYDPDMDSTDLSMGLQVPTSFTYSSISAVAAVLIPSGRLSLEWDHNRNKLGRDAAGNPTNLADDAVIVRAMAVF